jgi:hypothetical protein
MRTWPRCRNPQAVCGFDDLAEVPDDDNQLAEACSVQLDGELFDGGAGGVDEGSAKCQILDRVAGEHHLREGHQVCPRVGGLACPFVHEAHVAVDVTDGGVDLGEGETDLRHRPNLVDPHGHLPAAVAPDRAFRPVAAQPQIVGCAKWRKWRGMSAPSGATRVDGTARAHRRAKWRDGPPPTALCVKWRKTTRPVCADTPSGANDSIAVRPGFASSGASFLEGAKAPQMATF